MLYVVHENGGTELQIFDVTQTGSFFEDDFGVNAAIGLDRVLIIDRATGLWVVDVSQIVPEPSTAALVLIGLGLVAARRRG